MTYENVGTFTRLTGRSIHLIVTELPLLRDVKQREFILFKTNVVLLKQTIS
jgi:hypothetical protein